MQVRPPLTVTFAGCTPVPASRVSPPVEFDVVIPPPLTTSEKLVVALLSWSVLP